MSYPRCMICRGFGSTFAGDEPSVTCPRCEGHGDIRRPHVCGVPLELAEATERPDGDPVMFRGLVAVWRITEAQAFDLFGPDTLRRLQVAREMVHV